MCFPLLPLSETGRAKLSLAYEDMAFLDSLSKIKLKSQYFFSPVVFTWIPDAPGIIGLRQGREVKLCLQAELCGCEEWGSWCVGLQGANGKVWWCLSVTSELRCKRLHPGPKSMCVWRHLYTLFLWWPHAWRNTMVLEAEKKNIDGLQMVTCDMIYCPSLFAFLMRTNMTACGDWRLDFPLHSPKQGPHTEKVLPRFCSVLWTYLLMQHE